MKQCARRRNGFQWKWVIVLLLVSIAGGCSEQEAPTDTDDPAPLAGVPDSMTIDRVLRTDDRFSTLVAALDSTGLDSTLASDGPYTLLAPPDTAFARLPDGTMEVLLTERPDRLRTILSRHVLDGRIKATDLVDANPLPTLAGDSLRVRRDSVLTVGPATVVDNDVAVANGLIHVLDRVLPPPTENE